MAVNPAVDPEAASRTSPARVALVGNPNTGKTTIFNRLCGVRAKTANFPGTTAEMRLGRADLGRGGAIQVIDLPGVYQLRLDTPESRDAMEVLGGAGKRRPDTVAVLLDAANLSRNLILVGELIALDVPLVVCLNMTDVAARRDVRVDVEALARVLGAPVVPMVASRGIGMTALREALAARLADRDARVRPADAPTPESSIEDLTAWADRVISATVTGSGVLGPSDRLSERLDRIFTHPVSGVLVFLAVMGGLFWTLFALATVPMDLIETTFAGLGSLVRYYLPDGVLRDLLINGVIGGIAGTVVFLPQIMLLFFLISLLEDTGYLARAAFVNDRFFRRFGLPGQAFVPLLTAHACAIPGIMSTRLIPDRRDRLATILVLPFMSCSARLPVYVLLASLLFADWPRQSLAFASCYILGAAAAFLTAALFGRTILRGRPRPMVLELPTYKWPSLTNAIFTARDQGLAFLKTAGTIIFAICVVMWGLSAYPRVAPPAAAVALRTEAGAPGVTPEHAATLTAEAEALEAQAEQAGSFAGRVGRFVEPVFQPLGYDWQLTDGLLTSFVAREVFVSTMSVLAGAGSRADVDARVLDRIRTMRRDDGSAVFTPATAASALVFFVLAMQCLATLTVTRKEAGGLKYAAIQLGYMSGLAYVAALVVYQGLRAFGVN
jgi:ferrous iron transport protein B